MTKRPDDLETERRLRDAFKTRSEGVVMTQPWSNNPSPQRGGTRLVLAAAVIVALVGVGVAIWSGSRDTTTDVSTDTPPTTDVPSSDEDGADPEPESTAPLPDEDPVPDPGAVEGDDDGVPARSGLPSTYGPVTFNEQGDVWLAEPLPPSLRLLEDGLALSDVGFSSPEAAVPAWLLEVLEIEDPQWLPVRNNGPEDYASSPDAAIGVARLGEGGQAIGLGLTVGMAVTAEGEWYVTQVASDLVWIDSVELNGEFPGTLRVTGGGWAFEGTGLLYIDDADPVVVSVGAGAEPGRFSAVVPWDGDGAVEVMIVAPAIADGATPAATAFVAVPSEPTTTLSVIGVADDDVLNVRSGPGVANDVIGSLEPDATGLTHTGEAALVDGELWWELIAPASSAPRGWVNRRFVAVSVDPGTGLGREMMAIAVGAMGDLGPEAVGHAATSRYSERIEVGGIGVWADAAHSFQTRDPLQLDTEGFWDPPFEMAECVECTKTVREFLGVRERDIAEAEWRMWSVEPKDAGNLVTTHGLPREFYDRFATVIAFTPASDPQETLDWSRYTFVFDFVDGAPEVRGIYRWGWTP